MTHHQRGRILPPGQRKRILKRDKETCQYCGLPGYTVDHIIPWAWVRKHEDNNLVCACIRCNTLASDKIFDSFDAKRDYLLNIRRAEIVQEWGDPEYMTYDPNAYQPPPRLHLHYESG